MKYIKLADGFSLSEDLIDYVCSAEHSQTQQLIKQARDDNMLINLVGKGNGKVRCAVQLKNGKVVSTYLQYAQIIGDMENED